MLGVQGLTPEHAAMFARAAGEAGADSVIAMAPYVRKLSEPGALVVYYQAIADQVDVPICLQNHTVGTDMSVSTLKRILTEVPQVQYVKEETSPVHHKLTALMEMGLPNLKGVFGGAGGRYMLAEYPRGVCGQMPGCHMTDVMVRYWNALEADDWPEAKRIYGILSPLYAIETLCQGAIYKEVLRRRGVIASARSRNAAPGQMDEYDHRSLDDALRDLEPLFTWPNRKPLEYGVSHAVELSHTVGAGSEPSGAKAGDGGVDSFDR
jgi:4-hydroxy-tetrahydrodipicolinate synthase